MIHAMSPLLYIAVPSLGELAVQMMSPAGVEVSQTVVKEEGSTVFAHKSRR